MNHPTPSARAREVVADAYDLHVHVAPDVMRRSVDDVTLARRFHDLGMAGFVLKSHYNPTAERAEAVRKAARSAPSGAPAAAGAGAGAGSDAPAGAGARTGGGGKAGGDVLGAITLNGSVGGMNPVAVEIAARSGARVVWFPTVDASNQRKSRARDPEGATPPPWAAVQDDLKAHGIEAPAVEVLDETGQVNEKTRAVLELIARHNLVLATGHLSADEILAVVAAGRQLNIENIIVTHPEFTSQRLTPDQQRQLANDGALLERCFTTPYTGKVSWNTMIANIRATGPEHSFLSSDLGAPGAPPVEDGIALMADELRKAGFTDEDIRTMAVVNTRRLAIP
jgi:hypothetical protein